MMAQEGAPNTGGMILRPDEVLELLPQQEPFRFVDEILEVDEDHIIARYRFRPDADFYRGHFPGNPVTPGVILQECIAQVGVVALGIYLVALEAGLEAVRRRLALFADAHVDFSGIVKPGERVTVSATKVFFRRGKLRSEAEMHLDDGTLVCSGTISGMGVAR
ncbi:MAG: 3-hydroxyacyl-ACP dehydratase FabZ family protein [Gemmatimonadota bacterium]